RHSAALARCTRWPPQRSSWPATRPPTSPATRYTLPVDAELLAQCASMIEWPEEPKAQSPIRVTAFQRFGFAFRIYVHSISRTGPWDRDHVTTELVLLAAS